MMTPMTMVMMMMMMTLTTTTMVMTVMFRSISTRQSERLWRRRIEGSRNLS